MKTKGQLQELIRRAEALGQEVNSAAQGTEQQQIDLIQKGLGAGGGSHPSQLGGASDEVKAMRAFGCSNFGQLMTLNTGLPKFKNVPPYYRHLVMQAKQAADVARWVAQFYHNGQQDRIGKSENQDYFARVKNILDTRYGKEELAPRIKAFTSTGSGTGDEWVPTLMSSSYVEEYELVNAVEDKFQVQKMPSNPYDLPVQSGVKKARIIGENALITDTTFTTGKITFTATKLGEHHILPEEMTEDSAPDIMAAAREHVIRSQIRAVESALLNGDNDGTHIDSDTQAGAADLAEKAWKGLRRQALANSANGATTDFSNAAVTASNLSTQRARMKKFGSNVNELIWIAGPQVYVQFQNLTNVSTVDKFGPLATVLRGELAAYQGIPIINSEHLREDLNASGVYDGTTTNRAGLLLVNLNRWYVGIRRPIMVKAMVDLPYYDRFLLASYQRKDFQGHAQGATEVSVSYGYNIAV